MRSIDYSLIDLVNPSHSEDVFDCLCRGTFPATEAVKVEEAIRTMDRFYDGKLDRAAYSAARRLFLDIVKEAVLRLREEDVNKRYAALEAAYHNDRILFPNNSDEELLEEEEEAEIERMVNEHHALGNFGSL